MDIDVLLNDRGSRYGDFDRHAAITQELKRVLVNSPNWDTMPDDMREALDMTMHKVGRIVNGDPYYDDSWVDIIGYIQLVVNRLHSTQATELKKAA